MSNFDDFKLLAKKFNLENGNDNINVIDINSLLKDRKSKRILVRTQEHCVYDLFDKLGDALCHLNYAKDMMENQIFQEAEEGMEITITELNRLGQRLERLFAKNNIVEIDMSLMSSDESID